MATEKLGRYEILSELGRGAMGVVYKAIDPLIERTVALKTIKLDLSTEELANFEERFYREAKSAGRLNHPNIVTIYDIGKSENTAYMAMEFMEGRLLRDILDTHTALNIQKIVDIAAQIADGLAYAHEHGIVHRDIKPANIMLVRNDVAKIMDFGIAQMPSGARTLAGTVLGSPKYMAPEQIVGKTMDGRTDIFALGVILYELLTGEAPFDGDNINTIMYRILNENPPSPKSLTPRLPEAFNDIVAKALHKIPDERYQSAKEMASALRNYNKTATPNTDTSLLEQPEKPRHRPAPTFSEGDATILMNALPSGISHQAANPTQAAKPYLAIPFQQHHKKILFVTTAVLMLALAVLTIRGKTSPPKNIPSAQQNASMVKQVATATMPIPDRTGSAPAADKNHHIPLKTTPAAMPTTQQTTIAIDKKAVSSATPPNNHDAKKTGTATLKLAASPWGEIYIDGKKAGISPPLKKLTIPAGKHKIEIRNAQFKPYVQTIDLKADSSISIKHIFR